MGKRGSKDIGHGETGDIIMSKKHLSRRTFLRGSGGILVGIPFLEAMVPGLAWAQSSSA